MNTIKKSVPLLGNMKMPILIPIYILLTMKFIFEDKGPKGPFICGNWTLSRLRFGIDNDENTEGYKTHKHLIINEIVKLFFVKKPTKY